MTPADDRDVEARLRSALAARADSVEPAAGAEVVPALEVRAAAVHRRRNQQRVLLSVAAVVVVVAAITTALAISRDDDQDLATVDQPTTLTTPTTAPATTATTAGQLPPASAFDGPAIWPFETMSVSYDTPEAAASAFYLGYVQADGLPACAPPIEMVGTDRAVVPLCDVDTQVLVRDDGVRGWVVVGAESGRFSLLEPAAGSTYEGRVPIRFSGASCADGAADSCGVEFEIRPLDVLEPVGDIAAADGDDAEVEIDTPGVYVVLTRLEATATVRSITLSGPTTTTTTLPATTTSTTTAPAGDDGTVGWAPPGDAADDPTEAATAFARQVLGFADATVVGSGGELDTFVTITPRPTAGAATTVQVHDTGATRGWIVVGATSDQGRIDTPAQGDEVASPIHVAGVGTAFEAQVAVRVLSIDGEIVAQGTAFAGANGEQGPFDATIDVDRAGPVFVLVGEGDASGEGDLTWAAVTLVTVTGQS